MNNKHVDSAFRQILAGVAPPEPKRQIITQSEASRIILNQAAETLCDTDAKVALLQMVYDLGKIDGQLDATKEAMRKFTV